MKQRNDYTIGTHNPRIHFWCGLLCGAALGAWTGSNLFEGGLDVAGMALLGGAVLAYSAARWGDAAWEKVGSWLNWF